MALQMPTTEHSDYTDKNGRTAKSFPSVSSVHSVVPSPLDRCGDLGTLGQQTLNPPGAPPRHREHREDQGAQWVYRRTTDDFNAGLLA